MEFPIESIVPTTLSTTDLYNDMHGRVEALVAALRLQRTATERLRTATERLRTEVLQQEEGLWQSVLESQELMWSTTSSRCTSKPEISERPGHVTAPVFAGVVDTVSGIASRPSACSAGSSGVPPEPEVEGADHPEGLIGEDDEGALPSVRLFSTEDQDLAGDPVHGCSVEVCTGDPIAMTSGTAVSWATSSDIDMLHSGLGTSRTADTPGMDDLQESQIDMNLRLNAADRTVGSRGGGWYNPPCLHGGRAVWKEFLACTGYDDHSMIALFDHHGVVDALTVEECLLLNTSLREFRSLGCYLCSFGSRHRRSINLSAGRDFARRLDGWIFVDHKTFYGGRVSVYRERWMPPNVIGFTGDKGQIAALFQLPVCLFDDKHENIHSFMRNTHHMWHAMPVLVSGAEERWRGRVDSLDPSVDAWPTILRGWRDYNWRR